MTQWSGNRCRPASTAGCCVSSKSRPQPVVRQGTSASDQRTRGACAGLSRAWITCSATVERGDAGPRSDAGESSPWVRQARVRHGACAGAQPPRRALACCGRSAPRVRGLSREGHRNRPHPCVASLWGHVDCWRLFGDAHRGMRQSPRLPCLWSAPRLRRLARERHPLGRSLAWPHSPRHGARAAAQPPRPGWGFGPPSSPPT